MAKTIAEIILMKRKVVVSLLARITNVSSATKLATALTTVETLATKTIAKVISDDIKNNLLYLIHLYLLPINEDRYSNRILVLDFI